MLSVTSDLICRTGGVDGSSKSTCLVCAIGGSNCCWAVIALLDTDISMGFVIIRRFELKFDPGSRNLIASLYSALEGGWQVDGDGMAYWDMHRLERL